MELIDDFDKRNASLWSKVLNVDLKENNLNGIMFKQRPNKTQFHRSVMQAIWHGPNFLNEIMGNYNKDNIVDKNGNLLPYDVSDVAQEIIDSINIILKEINNN